MRQKISFDVRSIIVLIIAVVVVRATLFYLPEIKINLGEYAYGYVTSDFSVKNVEQLKNSIDNNKETLYYIGRGSCSDCRESVRNIKQLKALSEKKYHLAMEYVKLADNISTEERIYLDSIKVDGIPTIILVKNGNVKQFDFYDITAKNFVNKFNKFVQ
ncbi:MAG: hypothetical protein HFE76_03225 [Firmicutes bacterium]|nr:hypothetical protein [Bacillota bacterium]